MSKKHEAYVTYASRINECLAELFNEDSEHYINPEEFNEDNKGAHFFHALSTVAPCFIYGYLTGDKVDHLEFNHIANKLVFQFSQSVE